MNGWEGSLSNPIVILAAVVILGTICSIGAATLGWDKGVLQGMAKPEFARGVICYIFALGTIGAAVALLLQALVGPLPSDGVNLRLQNGKDILALLLGVFGTMVGFYFGSEASKGKATPERELELSTLDITPQPVEPEGTVTVRAVVRGNAPPYKFGLGQNDENPDLNEISADGGWITKQLKLTAIKAGVSPIVRVVVRDADGNRMEKTAVVKIAT